MRHFFFLPRRLFLLVMVEDDVCRLIHGQTSRIALQSTAFQSLSFLGEVSGCLFTFSWLPVLHPSPITFSCSPPRRLFFLVQINDGVCYIKRVQKSRISFDSAAFQPLTFFGEVSGLLLDMLQRGLQLQRGLVPAFDRLRHLPLRLPLLLNLPPWLPYIPSSSPSFRSPANKCPHFFLNIRTLFFFYEP